jgi:hypothetical protein
VHENLRKFSDDQSLAKSNHSAFAFYEKYFLKPGAVQSAESKEQSAVKRTAPWRLNTSELLWDGVINPTQLDAS